MAKVDALITPSVIRWARECAKLSIKDAATRIGRPIEEVIAWETGTSLPTIPQARKASEVYRRPLAVFYLPEPPKDFDTLRDFRSLPLDIPSEYSHELALIIRVAQYRQEWMRDFLIEEGLSPLSFVGAATLNDSPQQVGADIRKEIRLFPQEQIDCRTRYDALRLWIDRTEAAGIFIFRQGQIDLRETRGFVLCDEYAPFLYINSEDALAAQLFTLAHELAHLWLNQTGISNLEPFEERTDDAILKIEAFCNKIASETVLEPNFFYQELHRQEDSIPLEEQIENLSNIFKVSEETIARRMLDDQLISRDIYLHLRDKFQSRWRQLKLTERLRMKETGGGPSYYVKKAFNNGYSFTRTIISAFESGVISGRDASSLLNVKVNHIRRLASAAGLTFL